MLAHARLGANEWAGLALLFVGIFWRVLVTAMVFVKRAGGKREANADQLETRGLFGFSRNPLYIGNVLMGIGYGALHGDVRAFVLIAVLTVVIYHFVVLYEENFLRGKFGAEYDRYASFVPRWFSLRPVRQLRRAEFVALKFSWYRGVFFDYSVQCSTLFTVAVFFVARALIHGLSPVLGGAIAAGTIVYLTTVLLFLRKTKRWQTLRFSK